MAERNFSLSDGFNRFAKRLRGGCRQKTERADVNPKNRGASVAEFVGHIQNRSVATGDHNQVRFRSDADSMDATQLANDAQGIYKTVDIPVPRDGAVDPVLGGPPTHKRFILYIDNS